MLYEVFIHVYTHTHHRLHRQLQPPTTLLYLYLNSPSFPTVYTLSFIGYIPLAASPYKWRHLTNLTNGITHIPLTTSPYETH